MFQILHNKKIKYLLLSSAIIFIAVSFGLFWPTGGAEAQSGSAVTNFFANIIGNFLFWIVQLLASLLVGVIQMMVGVAKYNNFINATAVIKGWVIVRDVCNMFFIGVLLVIAFGTIFKWETYRYNKLLGRLVLMAFLINFSKFICGFFIDIFQVLMLTFINSFADVAAGNFVESLQLQEMLQMRSAMGAQMAFTGVVGAMLLAILLLTIAIVTIGAMLAIFLMRILMLWLLVVLSPLAFLMKTWPGAGERYSSQWWAAFGKYITVGPVLAFFVWLSLSIMSSSAGNLGKTEGFVLNTNEQKAVYTTESTGLGGAEEEVGAAAGERFGATISKISETENLLSFIIAISLLVGSLMMAQKMGVMGGQVAGTALGKITGGLKKVATLGAAAVGGGAIAAGIVANRKRIATAGRFIGGRGKAIAARKLIHDSDAKLRKFRWTTPTFWKGFMQRGERLDQVGMDLTLGRGEEFSEKFFKGPKAAMPKGDYAAMGVVNKKRGEYQEQLRAAGDTRQEMQDMGLRALATGGEEGHIAKMAFMSMITSKGNWDDLWETVMEQMNENPDFASENDIPPEVVEILGQGYNDTTGSALAAAFMGLDRGTYDPAAIRDKILSEATGDDKDMADEILEVDPKTGMNATTGSYRYGQLNEKQKKYLENVENQAQNIAITNSHSANERDRMALRTLSMSGIESRDTGHWEQLYAVPEPGTGRSHMILPIGPERSAYNEATGEAEKIGTRKFIGTMNPYLMNSKWYDPEMNDNEGGFRFRTDPRYQTRFQRMWMQGMVTPEMFRDFHHQAKRMPKQFLGIRSKVGIEDANFDDDGGFFNGEEQFNFDEKTETYSINEAKMDGTMNEFRKDGESRGFTGDKLSRFMMRKRRDLSKERIGAARDLAPATFDAYYRLGYYGDARDPRPVPFSLPWDGMGSSFSDEVLDDPEKYTKRVNQREKQAELDAREKYGHDPPEVLADKLKHIKLSAEAAREYYASRSKGKKKKMVDVNEGRQNATREKVEEQGAAFYNSEEYKNNKDAYYDEDSFNNNENVVQALKNQSDVNKMTGMNSAQKKAKAGGTAALAVNFDDEALKDLGLEGAGVNLRGKEMAGAIDKIGDKYLENLIRQNEDLADEDKKTEEQMVEEVEEFKKNLGNASSLRLVNKNRTGISARHVLTHEKYHNEIDNKVEARELNLDDEWNAMNEEEQNDVKEQLKNQGWNTESMNTEEIMKEYLAEGLTNQTARAIPGGTKLKAIHFDSLKEKGLDVKGEMPVEIPEIAEVEEAPSMMKLRKEALANSKWNIVSRMKDSIKGRKKNKETKAADTEGVKEAKNLSKLEKDATDKTTVRDQASNKRKKKEDFLKEMKNENAPKLAKLNKEIKENAEKAREEASKGNVSGAKEYHKKADVARTEALRLSENIREIEGVVEKARKEETKATDVANETNQKAKSSKDKVKESVDKSDNAAYGGEEEYKKHIDDEIKRGTKDRSKEEYKDLVEKSIEYEKNRMGKGNAKIDFEAQVRIKDLQGQLTAMGEKARKTDVEFEAKVTDAGGLEDYEGKLKKDISNIERRIKIAPDDEKVKLEADADKLKADLSDIQSEIAGVDARVEVGIKNAGGMEQFDKQLNSKIKNAQKELETAPDDKKEEIEDNIKSMNSERNNIKGRVFKNDEAETKKQAEEERKARADEIRAEAQELAKRAKAMETGDQGKADQLKQAAEKKKADTKKLQSKPIEFEGATDEMKEKEERIRQLESKNTELQNKKREIIQKTGSDAGTKDISKEITANEKQITEVSSQLPQGMAKALKDKEEKIKQFTDEASRLEKEAQDVKTGSPERASQLRKEASEKVKEAEKVETEEIKIKPIIKKEDLGKIEMSADLEPVFAEAEMQDAMRHAFEMEGKMTMPEMGEIDTRDFDHMVSEMSRTVEEMQSAMKDAAQGLGAGQSVAADNFMKKLTENFNQKTAQHTPESSQTRPDQYLMLYEFRRLIAELRNLRQVKQNLASPAPIARGKSERGEKNTSGGGRTRTNAGADEEDEE